MAQEKTEKVKTVSTKELYEFIKKSNLMKYIESEASLIRMIKRMVKGKNAKSMDFQFTGLDGKRITFRIILKNLEN